jgi:hypothetical protein
LREWKENCWLDGVQGVVGVDWRPARQTRDGPERSRGREADLSTARLTKDVIRFGRNDDFDVWLKEDNGNSESNGKPQVLRLRDSR